MAMYKLELSGLGVHGTTGISSPALWFEAEDDSDAVRRGAKISGAIKVSHNVAIFNCVGIIPVRKVIERTCAAGEAW